jgi:hypothetical protein
MILTVIGIVILAAIGVWIFGGVFLRVGGIIFAFVGAISLITLGDPIALFMVVLGLVLWLSGHWHYAVRYHEYKSPLAQRIFLQVLPPRYDPTRRWASPVVSENPPTEDPEERGSY